MTPVYDVADLRKTYLKGKVVANDGVSLTVGPGEIFGLLGPNGAGKTTFVRLLAGLMQPDGGVIKLLGQDVTHSAREVPRYVSFLGQRPLALFDLTPREAVYYTARLRGMAPDRARRATDELLDRLPIAPFADRLLEGLSGGEIRLASLAAALVGDLPILILDEPTNELDPANRRDVWNLLLELRRERGTTIILVTHNVLEAERVLDRVAIINHGRVLALGTPGELKRRVDARVRVEITARDGDEPLRAAVHDLGEVVRDDGRHLALLAPRDRATAVVRSLLERVPLELLGDFRILTTTLEDVYLALGGEQELEEE